MGASEVPGFVRLVGHPLRWRLVGELARSDLRVRELVDLTGEPQNLVSYHLRLLRDGGLVTSRRSSFDGRDSYYSLDLDRCVTGLADVGAALHPVLRMAPVPQSPSTRSSVLFVCSGNSARSPIAEALLRRRVGTRIRVSSAGTRPKDHVHPDAIRVLREHYDLDIAGQEPQPLDAVRRGRFDRVITLCDRAREALPDTVPWPRIHWSIPDPGNYEQVETVAAAIDIRVRQLIPTLTKEEG
ncbi:MAG TPA: ArsR family transcriptional regulator [Kribbella sp.]|nr:ArsR family transcriptional regulator [Kribbella sp.]